MCCAMTSPQHPVALFSSLLHSEPHCSAGYRSLLSTTGGTVALLAGAGPARDIDAVAAVRRPLCHHLHWFPCAPLTFCFLYAAV